MPSREQEAIRRINRKVTPDITQQGVVVSEDEFFVVPVHDTYTWVEEPVPHQEHTQTIGVTYAQYQAAYAAGKKILVEQTATYDGVAAPVKVNYYAESVSDLSVANAQTICLYQAYNEDDGLIYQRSGVFALTKDTTTLSGLKFECVILAGDGITYSSDSLEDVYITHEISSVFGQLDTSTPELTLWATNADFMLLFYNGLLQNAKLELNDSATADKYIMSCTHIYNSSSEEYATFAGQVHNALGVYAFSAKVDFSGDDEEEPVCSFKKITLWQAE